MKIIPFKSDDPELVQLLSPYLGSHEFFEEHEKDLVRRKNKSFYCLLDNKELVAFCSLQCGELKDFHVVYKYRRQGFGRRLFRYMVKNFSPFRMTVINPFMKKIILPQSTFVKLRGKYSVYEIK